jgi:hypothetical protein
MLRRQAQWQRERAEHSWAEKLRMAEQVREGVVALKANTKHGNARTTLPYVAEKGAPDREE